MLTKQELLPLSFNTQAVHAGEVDDAFGSPRTPLYSTTTFRFDSTADLLDVIEGRTPGCIYTRYGSNATINTLKARLGSRRHAEASSACGAVRAALTALILAHGWRGVW